MPIPYHQDPIYTSKNRTIANAAWEATVYLDHGVVALPDEYTQARGLMVSQRFPFDDSKGLYLINSHHNLHFRVSTRRNEIS